MNKKLNLKIVFAVGLIAVLILASIFALAASTGLSVEGKGFSGILRLLGPRGERGPMGPMGPVGPQGENGPQGPKGLSTPDYDSGWIDLTDKAGNYTTLTHNLNTEDIMVKITGKATSDGGVHEKFYGLTGYIPGWIKTYGGAGTERGNSAIQTKDNGYALIGYTNASSNIGSGAGVNNDVWLVKTNSEGVVQWSKTYGELKDERGYDLIQTKDEGFAIIGGNDFGNARINNNSVLVIKTDSMGNQQWSKTYYKANTYMWGTGIIETSDGGYALATTASNDRVTNRSFGWIIKTDGNGDIQWDKIYNGTVWGATWHIAETTDRGYAIAGYDNRAGGNDTYYRLTKVDSSGNIQWIKNYGDGTKLSLCRGFTMTRDGGFALAGFAGVVGKQFDIWVVRTDANGTMQWNRTYGGPKDDKIIWHGIVETADGFAIGGYTQSYGSGTNGSLIPGTQSDNPPGTDAWLVKIDAYGNLQWSKTFGAPNDDEHISAIFNTNDGGLALVGTKLTAATGNLDIILIKVGFEGEAGLARVDSTANSITLYRGTNDIYWNYVRVQIWKNS